MSAPLRFLALAVLGWAGVRAATLGVLPGAELFTVPAEAHAAPPIVPTVFPPLESVRAALPPNMSLQPYGYHSAGPMPPMPVHHHHYPARTHAAAGGSAASTPILSEPDPLFYSPIPQLDDWPLSRMASASMPGRRNSSPVPMADGARPGRVDRLQLSAWALLRGRPGTGALASGGTLGGS